jgi:hypothetical protein
MFTPAIISTALALAPPTELAPPDFGSRLDTVEFIDAGEDVQLVAYDASGEVIGMIALWVDEHERVHLASDYQDGYATFILVDGEVTIDATLPPDITRERAELMLLTMDYGGLAGDAKPTVRDCARAIAAAAAMCGLTGGWAVILCPVGLYDVGCECAKLADIEVSSGCDFG